jgi:hypothetical protein
MAEVTTKVMPTAKTSSRKSNRVGSCSFPEGMYAVPYSLAGFISARMKIPMRRTALARNGAANAANA